MFSFGGEGAAGQEVRNCIVIASRCAGGWAAIHIQEGGQGIVVQDNLVFSSGVDLRGNGRSHAEIPHGLSDGISTASRDTSIVNNLIYDATDEAIMVQGAPGTQVRGNVLKNILATCAAIQSEGVQWPNARQWNDALFRTLKN